MQELKNKLNKLGAPVVGDSDTMLTLFPKSVVEAFPGARFIVIHRDIEEARNYLVDSGLDDANIDLLEEKFKEAVTVLRDSPNEVIEVNYNALYEERMLSIIWDFVNRHVPFNEKRAGMLVNYKITEFEKSMYEGFLDENVDKLRAHEVSL